MNRRKIVGVMSLLLLAGLTIPSGIKASQTINCKNINLYSASVSAKKQSTQQNSIKIGKSGDVNSAQTNGLSNSKINFYDGSSHLVSTITFDTSAMKFNVKNNAKSFDSTNQEFFEIGLYSSSENKLINPTQINSGETSNLSDLLNGKSFKYGDIISLAYNNNVSIPVIFNGNNVVGNIVGNTEYFKITKNGLERVNLSTQSNQKANLTNINLNSQAQIASYLKEETDLVNKAINNTNLIDGAIKNSSVLNASTVCAFINSIGLENIQNFYGESTGNANFIKWVLNNNEAMSLWLEGNTNGASMTALRVWANIWNTYESSHTAFNLKLSIAVALTSQTPILDAFNGNLVGNPVQRYQIFESLNAGGGMYRYFNTLGVRLLKSVVDVPIENSQILQFRGLFLNNYNNLVNSVQLSSLKNIPNYSAKLSPRLIGNVVNGPNGFENISEVASIACRVFGQPVHEIENPKYDIQNVYTDLYSNDGMEQTKTSDEYLWISQALTSNSLKLDAINKAIQIQPLNIVAWNEKISLLKASKNTTANQYLDLSNDIMKSLKTYPVVALNLISDFNTQLKQVATKQQYSTFINQLETFISNAKATENILGFGLSYINDNYMQTKGFISNEKSYGEININAWNQTQPVASINFNQNGSLSVTGKHEFIATNANSGVDIKIYDNDMNLLKDFMIQGNEFGNVGFESALNNYNFNVGDIIMIEYNPGEYSDGYLTLVDKNHNTNKLSNNVVIQVTKNGLQPLDSYTTSNGEHYNFKTGFSKTSAGQEYLVNGKPKVGLQIINNKTYYFNNEGIMQTGVQTIGGQKYYFNSQGVMQTGWITVNNNREYFNELPYNFEIARNNIVNALAKAQIINLLDYTPSSVDVLSRAVNQGDNVINNQAVTIEQMQNATKAINAAIENLKAEETPIKNAINKASTVNLVKYTPKSVNSLSEAVNQGIEMLNNSNYTLEQVNDAANEILMQIKNLKPITKNNNLAA